MKKVTIRAHEAQGRQSGKTEDGQMKRKILIPILLAILTVPAPALADRAKPASVAGDVDVITPAPAHTPGDAVAFYALAAIVAGAALGCVISKNIVRMAMCLLGTLGGVALLYFLLSATFLGAVQLIVYAGGTLIVIVFGVMLTTRVYGATLRPRRGEVLAGAVVCLALLGGLTTILVTARWAPLTPAAESAKPVAQMGSALLTTYLAPFEIASVLLLAVMIGAAYLAEPERRKSELGSQKSEIRSQKSDMPSGRHHTSNF